MRETPGSATAPAARCKNVRRGSFIVPSLLSGDGLPQSLRLDVGRPDHLAPLLGLRRHIGAELRGGGEDHRRGGRIGEPRLDDRVCEPIIDLAVEPLDDLVWRTPRDADALPRARFEARHDVAYRRDIG